MGGKYLSISLLFIFSDTFRVESVFSVVCLVLEIWFYSLEIFDLPPNGVVDYGREGT